MALKKKKELTGLEKKLAAIRPLPAKGNPDNFTTAQCQSNLKRLRAIIAVTVEYHRELAKRQRTLEHEPSLPLSVQPQN